ncbi:MAG: SIMPL domain-containing protein [Parasphingopyxis sp.]
MRYSIFLPLFAIAAGGATGPLAAQEMAVVSAFEGTRLDIVATGQVTRVPDLVVINAGVVTEAATAQAALSENNRRMRSVLDALEAAGIAERDIQTSSINLNPRYDYQERSEPRLVGYNASNQLSIRFREIERAGQIIDALVGQGVNQINGPSLEIDNPDEAMDEARLDALTKARARAELYAGGLGMRVARIVAISEGGASRPPMPMARMAASDVSEESLQIAPGEQQVSVSLSVTFALE